MGTLIGVLMALVVGGCAAVFIFESFRFLPLP